MRPSECGQQHDRTPLGLSIEAKAQALIAWQRRSSPLDCPTVPLDVALLEMVMGAGGCSTSWLGLWQDAPVVVKLVIASKPAEHTPGLEGQLPRLAHSPSSNVETHPLTHSHPNVVQVFASRVIKLTEDMLQLATPPPTSSSPAEAAPGAAALTHATKGLPLLVSADGFGAPHPAQSTLQTMELASALRLMMGVTSSIPDMYLTQVGGERAMGDDGEGRAGAGCSGVRRCCGEGGQGGHAGRGSGQRGGGQGSMWRGCQGQRAGDIAQHTHTPILLHSTYTHTGQYC